MARRGNGGISGTAGGLLLGLVVLGATATVPRPAAACTDEGCYDSMPAPLVAELKGGKACYGIFGSGVPFLNPYNDTRANLALLLEDRKLLTLTDRRPPPDAPPKPADGVQPYYPVPFWIVNLRAPRPGYDPSATPKLPPDLTELVNRLKLSPLQADNAATRLAADQSGRCAAETPATVADFIGAVADAPGLADSERTALAGQRLAMAGRCLEMPDAAPLPASASSAAQDFAVYLNGARHFYTDALGRADTEFAGLAGSRVPWIAEAATYMIGRIHLNEAQLNAWGKYGDFDRSGVDQAKLTEARADLAHYLATYPDGRYGASAIGLARRIDWLAGDVGGFVGDVAKAVDAGQATHPDPERIFALLDEIDGKYLSEASISPLSGSAVPWSVPEIAATAVLTRMRDIKDSNGNSVYEPVATDEIAQHKAALSPATDPSLGDLVALEHTYFVDHDSAKVIQATDGRTPSPTMGNVEFSFFMLRGLALESKQRWQNGNDLWRSMLTAASDPLRADLLQLALALNDERSGKLAEVFQPSSPVHDPALHRPLLKYAAAPALLRTVVTSPTTSATDKGTALFTLLYKTLQQGDYRGFNEILAKYPPTQYENADGLHLFAWQGQAAPSYACPALAETTRRLAAGNDPVALNCLGEFFRHFEDKLVTGTKPPDDELGGTPDGFTGPKQTRLDYYLKVIANPKSHGDAEAYALSRAINCFASVGNNHCGEQDIPKPDRKRWFDRLKQTYKDNGWSKRQTYWW